MSTPPKAVRQIGEHKWMGGIHNILSNNEMKDQIVCWHETGWIYSMHLVELASSVVVLARLVLAGSSLERAP